MTTSRSTEGWAWSGGAKPAGNFRSIPCSPVCGSPHNRTLFTPGNRLSSSHFISSAAQSLGVLDGSSAAAGALVNAHAGGHPLALASPRRCAIVIICHPLRIGPREGTIALEDDARRRYEGSRDRRRNMDEKSRRLPAGDPGLGDGRLSSGRGETRRFRCRCSRSKGSRSTWRAASSGAVVTTFACARKPLTSSPCSPGHRTGS